MVVARDRYVAEDAAQRIRVDYEQLPVVVGIDEARRGAPGARRRPRQRQRPPAPGGRRRRRRWPPHPNTLTLDLHIERSASTPLEGKGVYARWDADDESLRLYSSTQTTTGVRAAVAAKLGMPLAKVECIAPDVGGGFGVKIMHPWPEEVLVPWAARMLGRDVKWSEDRREHFVSSAHERGQLQEVTVGFDDDGPPARARRPLLARQRRLHALRHHRPDHHGDPAARALQAGCLPGRVLVALHEHRPRHALPGAGRPQGCFAMERTMDAIAAHLGLDRAEVRDAATSSSPRRCRTTTASCSRTAGP